MTPPPPRSEAATTWKRWALGPLPLARALLYEEIASLVGAGMGMREALEDLAVRSRGRRRRAVLRLADAVAHGVPPGDAMRRFPECFAPVEAALVATGDGTGRYDRSFREAAAEVARQRRAAATLLRAVAYPLFLVHFALFVPACVIGNSFRGGNAGTVFAWVTFAVLWTVVGGGWMLHLARRGTRGWGRTVARLPFVGAVARAGALTRACRVAAALHDAGTGLPETLHGAADAAGNGWVASDLRAAGEAVRAGTGATAAFARVEAFDAAARSLLETGDRTGTLDAAFARIAELEEERAGAATRRVAVGLGAAIFLLVALAVFGMASSVFSRLYGGI